MRKPKQIREATAGLNPDRRGGYLAPMTTGFWPVLMGLRPVITGLPHAAYLHAGHPVYPNRESQGAKAPGSARLRSLPTEHPWV